MLIYHEIQTEDLEVVVLVARGYLGVDTLSSIGSHFFHLGEDALLEVVLLGGVC